MSDATLEALTTKFHGYDMSLGASTQFAEDTGFVPDRMIRGQNRLVAGVLIYQTRSELSYSCRGPRFAHLRTPCRTGVSSATPYGVDPVFKRGSDIYDIGTADDVGAFYNATSLAEEGIKVPRGFTQRQARGGIENTHSIDVKSPLLSPGVSMSGHAGDNSCGHVRCRFEACSH